MACVAIIDIGTVTARLAVVRRSGGSMMRRLAKRSTICNLGEGVAQTGTLTPGAIERVSTCVAAYLDEARTLGAEAAACTLTSAARDASNSDELLGRLRELGVEPTVIPGQVEGSLALLGVVQDFPGQRVLVADSGGGSTELTQGFLASDGRLTVEYVNSLNVGARRLTDLFLSSDNPPSADAVAKARNFCAERFVPAVEELAASHQRAQRLVLVGGTATSLVAIDARLDPYDSAYVHLHELSSDTVEDVLHTLASLTVEQRAELPGLQAKRAPVILGGTIAIAEVMRATGFPMATVSENDLLTGLSLAASAVWLGEPDPVAWQPVVRPLG